MSVGLVVHLEIEAQYFSEFLDIVSKHGQYSESHEPGCLSFSVIQPEDDEGKLILVEIYQDDDALASHWASPHMQRYRDKTNHMIKDRTRYKGRIE